MTVEVVHLRNLRDGRDALERARETGEIREIKRIGDLAAAAKRYAEAQRLSEDARRFAAELALDAKRALGECLAATPKNPGGRPTQTAGTCPVVSAPTLRELGVSEDESRQAQRIASIPADEYEQFKAAQPVDSLNTRQALAKAREIEEREYAPIIDAGERSLRVRRARVRKLLADAHALVADLHCRVEDVIDAIHSDDLDRHVEDLQCSARILALIADRIDTRQLRRVK